MMEMDANQLVEKLKNKIGELALQVSVLEVQNEQLTKIVRDHAEPGESEDPSI